MSYLEDLLRSIGEIESGLTGMVAELETFDDGEIADLPLLTQVQSGAGALKVLAEELGKLAGLHASDQLVAEGGAWLGPDGRFYEMADKPPKRRFDHESIRQAIVSDLSKRHVNRTTGEMVTYDKEAVLAGYMAACAVYISDSSSAKIKELKARKVEVSDVITNEPTGKQLVVSEPDDE